MITSPLFLSVYLFYTLLGVTDSTYFKSDLLLGLKLTPSKEVYNIQDDLGERVEISAMEDEEGILYWYRRIFTPVCLTGECKMVDVGLYWYCTGDFLGMEVYGEHLSKTDHSIFSEEDYEKLVSILNNDWSSLREYEFSDLIDESEEGVDGTSGATKKEIAKEAVADAVYTTFTLWHLVHGGEKEQMLQLTADKLNEGNLIHTLTQKDDKRYRNFILELFIMGKIGPSEPLTSLLIKGLKTVDDPFFKSLAIKSLSGTDTDQAVIQAELTAIYPSASMEEKLQILAALNGTENLDKDLYQVLAADLEIGNEWFLIKLLNILKQGSHPSNEVLTAVKKLLKSDNPLVTKAAMDFIGATKL